MDDDFAAAPTFLNIHSGSKMLLQSLLEVRPQWYSKSSLCRLSRLGMRLDHTLSLTNRQLIVNNLVR